MSQSFDSLAYAAIFSQTLPGEAGAERIRVAFASGNFFSTYRIQASIGRLFAEPEDRKGAALVAVLARGFWKTRFGGDPGILGRPIILEERIYTIIGVLPDFPYHEQADVYVPVAPHTEALGSWMREQHNGASVIGRLRTGVAMEKGVRRNERDCRAIGTAIPGQQPGKWRSHGFPA